MKKIITSLVLLFLVAMPGVSLAQEVMSDAGVDSAVEIVAPPDPEMDPMGFFETLFHKVQNGEWLPVFGLTLMVLVLMVRKFLVPNVAFLSWFKTKLGGAVLAFSMSLVLAIATALFAGQGITIGLVSTALGVAWAASGGWELVKDILASRNSEEVEAEV